ncbi:hypothetical protein A2U01_0092899, partial [Trifolium medium]|nr:hypothetical protein [Trifolium medium]
MARNAAAAATPPAPLPQDPSQQPGNVYYVHPSESLQLSLVDAIHEACSWRE